ERYYIFGGLALLLLALVAYLLVSVARYRRALRNARQAAPAPESDAEPKYITADDRASAAFSSVPAEVADETPVDVVVEEPAEVAEEAAAPAYTPAPAADPIARLYDSL